MVSPNEITGVVNSFWNINMMDTILTWSGYLVGAMLLLGFFYGVYLLFLYKYKVFYYEQRSIDVGSMKVGDSIAGLKDPKRDWARQIKKDGITKWRLLLARKTIEPVEFKFIGNKNKVTMIRTGPDTFVPAVAQRIFQSGNHVFESIQPIPTSIQFWQQTESRNAAIDFRKDGHETRMLVITTVAIVVILAFAAFTAWLIISNASNTVEHIDILSTALKSFNAGGPG